jgi:gluconolactonase
VNRFDRNGDLLKVIATSYNGQPLIDPNDVTIDPPGGFYFTDSGSPPGAPVDLSNPQGKVYYVDPTDTLRLAASGIAFANGVVISADRQHLFVAESLRNRILEYDIASPGVLTNARVFANLPPGLSSAGSVVPDGLALDIVGDLYVAHYGAGTVDVLDASGALIREYPAGDLTASNLAFGGPNDDQLYISGGLQLESGPGAIYVINVRVPGLDIRPAQ